MRERIFQKKIQTKRKAHYYEYCKIFDRIVILVLAFLFIGHENIFSSIPPHPRIEQKIKDGTIPTPYHIAKQTEASKRGINSAFINPRSKGNQKRTAYLSTFNALAILIQFTDKPAKVNASAFDTLLFANGDHTLKSYYQEVSYGRMDIITVNLPSSTNWLDAPQTYNYYVDGQNGFGAYPKNAQKMVEDAITAIDNMVDFSRYDNDGDGYVDAMFVIHSGSGAEYTGSLHDIWSHQWTTYSPVVLDGVGIYSYMIEPEYWIRPGDMTCGVYAHEMGHAVFGLPDLYDYDRDSKGLGRWSLMASGGWNGDLGNSPAHPDPWSRIQMGFMSPIALTEDMIDFKIFPIEDTSMVIKYIVPESNEREYFLLENRRKIGFDKYLRGEGLLIYHIDEGQSDNGYQWYPGHTENGHYKIALEQADGLWNLERNNNAGDAGDPYPGSTNNTAFNDLSTPDSKSYTSQSTNLTIANIHQLDNEFFFSVNVHKPVPQIVVDHLLLNSSLELGDSIIQSLMVKNVGLVNLDFHITRDTLSEWLQLIPESGIVAPGSFQSISLQINTHGIVPGVYQSFLNIESNDSTQTRIIVSISLTISSVPQLQKFSLGIARGWNLISNPMIVKDSSLNRIFSSLSLSASGYHTGLGYQVSSNMQSGLGYWMKSDSAHKVEISGTDTDSLIIRVDSGWNMIGSISTAIPVNQIIEEPQGNIVSSIFGYRSSYSKTDTIFPGGGYWVKTERNGYIKLKKNVIQTSINISKNSSLYEKQTTFLTFRDADGSVKLLYLDNGGTHNAESNYELPPFPPAGVFDVRFASNVKNSFGTQMQYVNQNNSSVEEFTIKISSGSYPIVLTWHQDQNIKGKFILTEINNNNGMNSYLLTDTSVVVLNDPRISILHLRVQPSLNLLKEFVLYQNYPNPFNPKTTLKYSLLRDSKVKLTIYDALGQVVDVLMDAVKSAGYQSVEWNASNIASGVYFYKLETTSTPEPSMYFVQVKRMILLK